MNLRAGGVRTLVAGRRIAKPWRDGRLLLAVVASAMLTMPLDYRAGADHPHPHAAFQLWLDVADGLPLSHAHGGGLHHHAPGHRAHRTDVRRAPPVSLPDWATASDATPSSDQTVAVAVLAAGPRVLFSGEPARALIAPTRWADVTRAPESPPPRRDLARS